MLPYDESRQLTLADDRELIFEEVGETVPRFLLPLLEVVAAPGKYCEGMREIERSAGHFGLEHTRERQDEDSLAQYHLLPVA